MNRITERQIIAAANRLPSLGTAVGSILASMEKPTTNIHIIATEIGRDPAITSRVLRIANAAFFGHSGQIGSITDAIVILGLDTVRTIVLSASVMAWINAACGRGIDLDDLWRHSVGAAVSARVLAGLLGHNRESAFVSGLLHDIGRILLMTQFPHEYAAALRLKARKDLTLSEAEDQALGINAAKAGYFLLNCWHFPAVIQEAVRDHLDPVDSIPPLVALTHAAHTLAQVLEPEHGSDENVPQLTGPAFQSLGLSTETLRPCFGVIESQYKELMSASFSPLPAGDEG